MRDVSAYVSPPEPIPIAELYAKSEQWKYEREVRVIRSLADCEDRGPGPRGFTVYTQQLPQAGIKSARLLSTNSVRASAAALLHRDQVKAAGLPEGILDDGPAGAGAGGDGIYMGVTARKCFECTTSGTLPELRP
jgi:hypothetical protein